MTRDARCFKVIIIMAHIMQRSRNVTLWLQYSANLAEKLVLASN